MLRPFTNRWAVLALIFFVGISVPMQFQAVMALAPFLVKETSLTYSETGFLTGLFMLPGAFLAIPGGVLANKIGSKNALVLGLAMMTGGAFLFVWPGASLLMSVARVIGGIGAAILLTQGSKVISDWFQGKEINTAMAFVASSFGLGVGVATALLPVIAASSSWQSAALVNAFVAAVALLLVVTFLRDIEGDRSPSAGWLLWNINNREVVLTLLAGLGRGLFVTGYIVFMSFVPVLLVEQGMTVERAALLVSIVAVVSAVSVPLGGYLSDATGRPNLFIVAGAIGAAVACFAIPYLAPALVWIVLFGLLRGGCTGGIMALPAEVLQQRSRNTGFAIASTVYFVSMAVVPPLAGYILELTSSATVLLWFAGVLWLMIVAALAVFRALQRQWA